jgi:hypothetical protein
VGFASEKLRSPCSKDQGTAEFVLVSRLASEESALHVRKHIVQPGLYVSI